MGLNERLEGADDDACTPSGDDIAGKVSGDTYVPEETEQDRCMDFYERARSALPNALKIRREILEDIRESRAGSKRELSSYYRKQGEPGKIMVCRRYL